MNRIAPLLLCLLTLVACSRSPESSTPGPQSGVGVKKRGNPTKTMVSMNDPAIDDYIVKDVSDSLEANTWRWTYERPELRFQLKDTKGQKVEMHFSIADATFKTTGPVTANFFVNDHPIGTMKITKPGDYVFSKAVPPEWLKTDGLTVVAAEVRPLWTSQGDGRHLGMILTQAGFVPDTRS